MHKPILLLSVLIMVGLLLSPLGACRSVQPASQPEPAQPVEPAAQADVAPPPAEKPPQEPPQTGPTEEETKKAEAEAEKKQEEAKQEAKKQRDRKRKQQKLKRNAEVAKMKLEKAQYALARGEKKFKEQVAKVQADLDIAQAKLNNFTKIHAPNRVARAELNLQRSEDRYTDAQHELQQLRLMYDDEQFADQTKEIVIQRAERQLERSQRDLELRRGEFDTLQKVTLPLEHLDLQRKVQETERALRHKRWDHDSKVIDWRIGVISGELEIVRLDNELSDVAEEIEEAEQEKREQEQKEQEQKEQEETEQAAE